MTEKLFTGTLNKNKKKKQKKNFKAQADHKLYMFRPELEKKNAVGGVEGCRNDMFALKKIHVHGFC